MRRRSNRALSATALAVLLLILAGCTGQDLQTAMNDSLDRGSANLTATVGQCQTGNGVTSCRIETTNRLGSAVEARVTLDVVRNGTVLDRQRTTTTVDAGRSYVSMTFGSDAAGDGGTYEAAIERAR